MKDSKELEILVKKLEKHIQLLLSKCADQEKQIRRLKHSVSNLENMVEAIRIKTR